jgi:uncharacterized protein with HEPN domain
MSERRDSLWISDIKEAITRVEEYTEGISYAEFLRDKKTQDAVVRNVEIISEAVKKISADFKRKHKDVDWKAIAGMRDKLIHDYFGVNWSIFVRCRQEQAVAIEGAA